jgi:hypothetical protein
MECRLPDCDRYVFGSGEERSLRALMGSALGGADFEWAKGGIGNVIYLSCLSHCVQICNFYLMFPGPRSRITRFSDPFSDLHFK